MSDDNNNDVRINIVFTKAAWDRLQEIIAVEGYEDSADMIRQLLLEEDFRLTSRGALEMSEALNYTVH